jgi:hypothetical protein
VTNEELSKLAQDAVKAIHDIEKKPEVSSALALHSIAASLLVIARHFEEAKDSPGTPHAKPPLLVKPPKTCNGLHCRCIREDCPNPHPYDHVCRYSNNVGSAGV